MTVCPECGGNVVTVRSGPVDVDQEDCLECAWGRSL